jgi:membrane-bound serine protease (ClpP class)
MNELPLTRAGVGPARGPRRPQLRSLPTFLVGFLAVLLAGFALGTARAASTEPRVDLLTVTDAVDPMNAQYVQRGLQQAAGDGATAVLIELNTPGGLDSAMRTITGAMLACPVPIVVYVTPSGARAGSAGVFILMAADVAAMAPGTNVGAAHPVDSGGSNLPDDERVKVTNDAAAYMRTLATTRHHNATWAEQSVRESVALTADEAKQQGVIDLVSPDRATLLADLDGRTIQRGATTLTLQLRDATVSPVEMTAPEQLLHLIDDPNVAYLLLSLGAWAILAELFHPGTVLPGVVGVICLALALTALESLPFNGTGLALLGVAVALFVLDLKAPTHGALTAAGLATFIVGSLLLFAPYAGPLPTLSGGPFAVGVSPALVGFVGLGLAAFFAVGVRATLKARRRPVMALNPIGPGSAGRAMTDLRPGGSVRVQGEDWTALAEGDAIQRGEPIEVISRDGLRLRVRRRTGM